MDGFLRFLGWLFLIFLAYLILGWDKSKWKTRLRELKAEYKKANEEFVRRYKRDKELEARAKRLSQLALFAIYSILFIPLFAICSHYNLNVMETVTAGFGTYMLFSNPISYMIFGKTMGAEDLYATIKNQIREFLNKKNNFNSALVPVYLKKRDSLREEIVDLIQKNKTNF
jgi:hypothetical protein